MSFPARTLTKPRTFVIEVGTDGFNAYALDETRVLLAASSVVSTFLKVCEDIANCQQAPGLRRVHFLIAPESE